MKRRFSTLLLALLLAVFASASAEEILYTGTVSKPMTIRAKKSTSAAKLGSVETGELINIVEYGSEWTKVDQNGVVGYVLTRNVEDLAAAAGYNDEADAQYLGVAERNLTIRAEESKSAQKLQQLEEGMTLFTFGLAKKVLIANQVGALWEQISAMSAPTAVTAWLGAIAFTFQIYFDFSGYSDMAIGLGHLFGFHFLENFEHPYESRTVTEFWRRWHISLGTWFREYVYIPLGGNRHGKARQILNLAIVWFLTGLWHGASWNFVLWGLYYAVLLILEKLFLLRWLDKAPKWVGHVYTIFAFIMGWVLFAITDFAQLGQYVSAMFTATFVDGTALYLLRSNVVLLIAATIGCTTGPLRLWNRVEDKLSDTAAVTLRTVGVVLLLLLSIAFLVGDSYNPFLYFRF